MWDVVFNYLKENMETIKKIPGPIAAIFILMFLLTWWIHSIRYDDRFKSQELINQSQESIIKQLEDSKTAIKVKTKEGKEDEFDFINIKLKTKEHLAYIPSILSLSDSFIIRIELDEPKRIGEYIIEWSGRYFVYNSNIEPKFKMEIYYK